ncbi:MAG: hypothetical protein K6F88_06800 [Ruminococcus sp.]|nr:hypothetical protein [Ruminococcus sp.]
MKPLLSILVAVLMTLSGMTIAFAEESDDDVQTVLQTVVGDARNVTGDNAEGANEDVSHETEPDETQPSELSEESSTVISGKFKSSDGNYLLYIFDDGELAYADIIKYIGKDKLPKNYTISEIDGYKIRQIRSKAFFKLKSLIRVKFTGTYFSSKVRSSVEKNAFYNCKKMTSFTTDSFVTLKSKCVGYVNGKRSKKFTTLTFSDVTKAQSDVSSKLSFAKKNDFNPVYNVSGDNRNNRKAKLVDFLNGEVFRVKVAGKTVNGWKSSNPEAVSITAKGKATVLAKGKTTLSVKVDKLRIKREFAVTTNPYLTLKGKKVTSVTVKNGKHITVGIKGKAADVDNVYDNTGYAEVTSEADAEKIKVKGTRRGGTSVKVYVNGAKLKLKVDVEKNPITDEKMAKIASKVGHQSQYVYDDSKVMCSAYSFCYAYYQVTGNRITPGSVWCPGGCMWLGGTYTHFSSAPRMLKAIKKSVDKNQACVGLLSIGNSATHYVTFYDYEGEGKNLSDFKILDPWDGNLTTGLYYGYSYGYHVVTIDT